MGSQDAITLFSICLLHLCHLMVILIYEHVLNVISCCLETENGVKWNNFDFGSLELVKQQKPTPHIKYPILL